LRPTPPHSSGGGGPAHRLVWEGVQTAGGGRGGGGAPPFLPMANRGGEGGLGPPPRLLERRLQIPPPLSFPNKPASPESSREPVSSFVPDPPPPPLHQPPAELAQARIEWGGVGMGGCSQPWLVQTAAFFWPQEGQQDRQGRLLSYPRIFCHILAKEGPANIIYPPLYDPPFGVPDLPRGQIFGGGVI